MNVDAIRAWLMLQPRPKSVRCTTEGVTPTKLDIAEGQSWKSVAESVAAIQPELLEAMAVDGSLIRASRPRDFEDEPEEEEERADVINEVVTSDPESARLIIFARLLADAYRHSTDVAFDKMIALFEASSARSEALEKSLELTQRILTKAAADKLAIEVEREAGGTGQASLLEQLIGSFIQGKAQAEAAKTHTAANGAAKPEAS